MECNAITTIINLISTIRPDHQELLLLSELNNFFNFDHNIFLFHQAAATNRFLKKRKHSEFTPQTLYTFKSVEDNVTGLETLTEIKTKNTFLIVVPESISFEFDSDVLFRVKEIQRMQTNMKIGVFYSNKISSYDLKKLFEWFWKYQIKNIFVAFNSNPAVIQESEHLLHIFTFNPFGRFEVVNITGSKAFDKYFLSENSNFQQYPLRVAQPFFTFITSGSDEYVWQAVFHVLNASTTQVECNYNVRTRVEFFEKNLVDIVLNVYSVNAPTIVNTYPMSMEDVVLSVPQSLPYPEFSSYLKTIASDNFFTYSISTVFTIMALLSLIRYVKKKKILFLESVADVLNLLMNDNGAIKYQNLFLVETFLIIPLTFTGFVIVNGILSNLQSYLTRPVFQPQVNTIEDIHRSSFPILTDDDFWARRTTNILETLSGRKSWNVKIRVVDGEEMQRHTNEFNLSTSFLSKASAANIIIDVQKRLNIIGYHIAELHIDKFIASYPVNMEFPFTERLNEIIHWIRNAGLYEKWLRDDLRRAADVQYKRSEHLKNRNEADIERFPIPMFIVYGWCAGIALLFIEIFWKNFIFPGIMSRESRVEN